MTDKSITKIRRYSRLTSWAAIAIKDECSGLQTNGKLTNWSAAGASVILDRSVNLPQEVTLIREIASGGEARINCHVRWVDGRQVGLLFLRYPPSNHSV